MGLKDKLKEFKENELEYVLPDGSVIGIKPVNAMAVVPRLGLPPQVLRKFFQANEEAGSKAKADLEKSQAIQTLLEDPDVVAAGTRWEEAYWVEGIVSLDGEPVRLVFSHEAAGEDDITVETFRAFIAGTYGQKVHDEISERIKKVSGYVIPEEVQADAEAFPDNAGDAARSGEGVRDEPAGPAEAAAGGA